MPSAEPPAERPGAHPPTDAATKTSRPGIGAARRWQRPLIAVVVAVLVTAVIAVLPEDNAAEGGVADRLVASRAALLGERPLSASEHVVVIGVDQRSLDSPDLATLPRVMFSPIYKDLVSKALEHGAKGVVLDFILAYDPATLRVGEERPLRRYDNDFLRLLRKEAATGRLVLGKKGTLTPADRFIKVAKGKGLGEVDVPIGAGNVIRTVPPALPDLEGGMQPTLSGLGRKLLGDARDDAVLILPPAPLDTLPGASLIDVRDCKNPERLRALFSGRLVLVGSMAPGEDRLKLADRLMARAPPPVREGEAQSCDFPVPKTRDSGDESLPGVYAHAAGVDGALSGWAPAPAERWTVLTLVGALAFVAALVSLRIRPVLGGVFVVCVAGGAFLLGILSLDNGVYLPSAGPMLAGLAGFGVTWGIRLGLLDRQANATQRAFGRYLSPVLVKRMIETGETPELGGEPRDVSVLFADLSGFTATSEKMESDALTALVNRYLDRIDEVIQAHGGYVDKFIGDAVMAIFNAPARIDNHAKASVDAAHEILRVVEEEAVKDRRNGLPGFSIKVGISSGPATVGNVGSRKRLNYTVIGDTVNQAARFESLPGLFKTPIVIGPETARRIEIEYELLPIVSIQVKGKSDGLLVFAPLALRGTLDDHIMDRLDDYAIALQAFEEGKFETASALWEDLAVQGWPGAEMSGAMAEEARYTATLPLPDGWNGVLEARGK